MSSAETVHQVVPTLAAGDAVGAHTRRVRDLLRRRGVRSEIFTDDLDPRLSGEARPLAELPDPRPGRSALIYQCSIGNDVVDRLLARDEPLIVNYHNLTPAAQLMRWAPEMAHLVTWGRHQLRALARRAVLGIGDSRYNSAELVEVGFSTVATAPVLLDLPTGPVVHRPLDGRRWLFVGRIVPNKAQHDLIAALAWYRAVHDPTAELRLVGASAADGYREALDGLVADLGLTGAVTFTGPVDDDALRREYEAASSFVCLSDHEGFGIPLLEAMALGAPVIALGAAAVPETVGAAGLVLPAKSPALVAAAVHRTASDPALARQLVAAGRARADQFDQRATGARFLDALAQVLPLPELGSPRPQDPGGARGSIDRP